MMRSVFSHRVAFCWNVSPRLDALSRLASLLTPISSSKSLSLRLASGFVISFRRPIGIDFLVQRSEEHTSELQSHLNLVCRLLLEKKKKHVLRANPSARRMAQSKCLGY